MAEQTPAAVAAAAAAVTIGTPPHGAVTETPHSDAVANIVAASPDLHNQAAAGQAANAGLSPAPAGYQAVAQAANAGLLSLPAGYQAAAQATDDTNKELANNTIAASAANQSAAATAAAAAAAAPAAPPIPTITITTPNNHTHTPHQRLSRADLKAQIATLTQRIKELKDLTSAQETAADKAWAEKMELIVKARLLEEALTRKGVEVAGLRGEVDVFGGEVHALVGMVDEWRERARWAEGVLRGIGAWVERV